MVDYSKAHTAFDDSPIAVVLLEAVMENGKPVDLAIRYANILTARLWDTTPDHLIGRRLHDFGRDLDGKLLDVHLEIQINRIKRTVYDYSANRDRHLKFDCFYYDKGVSGCYIQDADLEAGVTFSLQHRVDERPMTDFEKTFARVAKTFAVSDIEAYNLEDKNDFICFSDIKTRKIIEVIASDSGAAKPLLDDDLIGKKCYKVLQDRTTPCAFCSNRLLHKDRYHVWLSHNETLNKDYLHKTKMVKLGDDYVRMDIAQDVTDDKRKAAILAETMGGMSLWTECMSLLVGEIPLGEVIAPMISTIGEFFEAASGIIVLYGSSGYQATWAAKGEYPVPPMFADPTQAALDEWGQLLRGRARMFIGDTSDERIPAPLRSFFASKGITSTSLSPVFIGDYLEGVLCLNNVSRNKTQIFIADMVAQSIAHALRQAEMQEHMNYLRFRDSLTGYLNFDGFRFVAERLIRENPEKQFSLWYSDIRRFKYVNDMFGYEMGDGFLRYWADVIEENIREGETFCRISADNLSVLRCYDDLDDLYDRFDWLIEKLGDYPGLKNKNFKPELVSGIYLLDEEDMREPNINKMLNRANIAQKSVKGLSGKQMAIYDDSMRQKQLRELDISQHLEEGLDKGEFFIFLQPQYKFTTNEIIGAEALVRWNHPTLGSISPAEFIPLLEKAGLISKLDLFVWEEACKFIRYMLDKKDQLAVVPLSVNISRVDLYLPDLAGIVLDLVKKYEIPQDLLKLEITESAYTDDSKQLISVVEDLQNRGFSVEMDDFGSGYSSLNILKEVPVDVLKLDMRFLAMDNMDDQRGGSILSSVVRMAHWISLPVIAEGVETKEQADYLKSLGCYMMQGFYFAKPMPINEFEKLLGNAHSGEMTHEDSRGDILRSFEFLNAEGATSFLFNNCIGGGCLIEFDGCDFEALLLNDQFYTVMGISREVCDQYRTHMIDLYEPKDRENMIACFNEAVEKGTSTTYTRPIRDGGDVRWIRAVNRYLASRDGKHMLFALVEDVTDLYLLKIQSDATKKGINED